MSERPRVDGGRSNAGDWSRYPKGVPPGNRNMACRPSDRGLGKLPQVRSFACLDIRARFPVISLARANMAALPDEVKQ
jgi:hypothetical protein